MALTLQEFDRLGIREELAKAFFDRVEADQLLDEINFPVQHRPGPAVSPQQLWNQICPLISTGVIDQERGFDQLLAAAAKHRPGNRVFRQPIDRLNVEGPDQRRFRLEDVPAVQTLVEHIVRRVVAHYDGRLQQAQRGQRRRWVADQVNPNGRARRLDLRGSLRDNGLHDGDMIQVSPEAVAGVTHEEALATVRRDVDNFLQGHPAVEMQVNFPEWAPTQYLLRFSAPGWEPPARGGVPPRPVDRHEVFIDLPPEFPAKAPVAYWQTPIFHPNVRAEDGAVCLGELQEGYRPAMDFGLVLQALIDIGSWRNYNVRDVVNVDASAWARSGEGQAMIAGRGGRTIAELEGDDAAPMPEFVFAEVKATHG